MSMYRILLPDAYLDIQVSQQPASVNHSRHVQARHYRSGYQASRTPDGDYVFSPSLNARYIHFLGLTTSEVPRKLTEQF